MASEPIADFSALRALVESGDGSVELVDPETNRTYIVTEKPDIALSDEYIGEKLDEARADLREGRVSDLSSSEEILAEARRRHEAEN